MDILSRKKQEKILNINFISYKTEIILLHIYWNNIHSLTLMQKLLLMSLKGALKSHNLHLKYYVSKMWGQLWFGYLDNWILGYHAYSDTWTLGYMDIHFLWINGYLDTLDIKNFRYPNFGYPIQVSGYLWILF